MTAIDKIIRVLIVEDSRVISEFLTEVLNAEPNIQVVGTATDGREALAAAQKLQPDVITMDINMPNVDGFEATRSIMESCPTPIVIVSGSPTVGEVATNFKGLEAGALAVIARPYGIGHPEHESSVHEMVETVKLMSEIKVVRRWVRPRTTSLRMSSDGLESSRPVYSANARIVAIGASTGGPLALQTILSQLPREFPLPVLIVQHMTPTFTQGFADWLGTSTPLPVRLAVAGDVLQPGTVYIAPDDYHTGLGADLRIFMSKTDRENGMRPAVSYLFRSIKANFGAMSINVLLTGMGVDGAEELKALKDAGAVTIAQDEASSIVHGMPGQAIKIGGATHILSPSGIAKALTYLAIRS